MDRYQFEDHISDYIENSLPLKIRNEFESYMDAHPDARDLVQSVSGMISRLHHQPRVKTSDDFMKRLMAKVNQTGTPILPGEIVAARTWWGFTPKYAFIMSGLLLALVLVGTQLIPSGAASPVTELPFATEQTQPQQTPSQMQAPATQPVQQMNAMPQNGSFATTEEDSANKGDDDLTKPDFEGKIRLVKNQH